MTFTLAETAGGYHSLWAKCTIRPECVLTVNSIVTRILAHKQDYLAVEQATHVPWFFMACLHSRESDLDFNTYLGNGDPLDRKTTDVPAGRGPFHSFIAGAVDSMNMQGFTKILAWPIEQCLYAAEEFNGEGYEYRNENSAYVWAGTNLEQRGKFTGDGRFDPNAWDEQPGVAALLKGLIAADVDVKAALGV